MNIQEIQLKIFSSTKENERIKPPYHMIESAVKATMDKANLDVGSIDYCDLHFYKVIHYVEAIINHLGLEYDIPKLEDDTVDLYSVYEDFIQVYEMSEIDSWTYDDLIEKYVGLAEKEYVSLGMFEGRILSVVEKLSESVSKISDVATDKKKLKPLLAEFIKVFKGLDISGLKELKESKEK